MARLGRSLVLRWRRHWLKVWMRLDAEAGLALGARWIDRIDYHQDGRIAHIHLKDVGSRP